MGKATDLSRRERQIMDILYSQGEATVKQIQEHLPDPPTEMAIRRLMQILEEKGWLNRKKAGRAVVYSPRSSKKRAGADALKHVLDTFFGGAVDDALVAHLTSKETVTPEQLKRLEAAIKEAKAKKGDKR